MQQYSRKISAAVFCGAAVLAVICLQATGQFRFSQQDTGSIDSIEREIAQSGNGSADEWSLWNRYGDALRKAGDFARAATAYKKSLTFQPVNASVSTLRFNALLAVAQSNDADQFFTDFAALTAVDPKLAVDATDRAELSWLHGDTRWGPAVKSARIQAAD